MKNPYKIPSNKTQRMYVHSDLIKLIERYNRMAQRDCDMKFGKGKFKVPKSYGSKIIVGLLK